MDKPVAMIAAIAVQTSAEQIKNSIKKSNIRLLKLVL
jgi:hypothetical protein